MKKYPKIKYPSHEATDGLLAAGEVRFIEKYDGGNFRFRYKDGGLLMGSRNVEFSKQGDPLPYEEVNKAFRHVHRYLYNEVDFDALERHHEAYEDGLVFFGEAMHTHSIDYDAWDGQEPDIESDVPNFVGFDVFDRASGEFLDWDTCVDIYGDIGLRTAQVYQTVPVEDLTLSDLDEYEIPQSEFREPDPDTDTRFDRKGLAEGVVLRNDDTNVRAKIVHPEFKEKNAIAFEDKSKARTEAGKFIAQYVTTGRIRKHAHKIVDDPDTEYDDLEMSMMELLPRRVLTDIMEEEGWEILGNDIELTEDSKYEIRSKASKKCARILRKMCEAEDEV